MMSNFANSFNILPF